MLRQNEFVQSPELFYSEESADQIRLNLEVTAKAWQLFLSTGLYTSLAINSEPNFLPTLMPIPLPIKDIALEDEVAE